MHVSFSRRLGASLTRQRMVPGCTVGKVELRQRSKYGPDQFKVQFKVYPGPSLKMAMGLKTMAAPKKTAGNIWGLKAIFQSFVTQLSASISSTENSMVNPTSSKFNSEFNSKINEKQPFSFQVTTLQQDKTNTNF